MGLLGVGVTVVSTGGGGGGRHTKEPTLAMYSALSSALLAGQRPEHLPVDAACAGVNPSGSARADARRVTPGFWPQFVWCLGRAMAKRSRQPLAIFTNYCIIGLTGGATGCVPACACAPPACWRASPTWLLSSSPAVVQPSLPLLPACAFSCFLQPKPRLPVPPPWLHQA